METVCTDLFVCRSEDIKHLEKLNLSQNVHFQLLIRTASTAGSLDRGIVLMEYAFRHFSSLYLIESSEFATYNSGSREKNRGNVK